MAKIKKTNVEFLPKDFLNVSEAAKYTRLSTSYIYKLALRDGIPTLRSGTGQKGSRLIFSRAELKKWMHKSKKKKTLDAAQ